MAVSICMSIYVVQEMVIISTAHATSVILCLNICSKQWDSNSAALSFLSSKVLREDGCIVSIWWCTRAIKQTTKQFHPFTAYLFTYSYSYIYSCSLFPLCVCKSVGSLLWMSICCFLACFCSSISIFLTFWTLDFAPAFLWFVHIRWADS